MKGATGNWVIGKAERTQGFAIRYHEVEQAGFSHAEAHEHDQGLRGQAKVILNDEEFKNQTV